MKILYLHQYFTMPNQAGGTRSYEMAKRLVQMGHHVTIVTSSPRGVSGFGWTESYVDGIRVISLPVRYGNEMSFFRRALAFIKFSVFASVKVICLRADVVFATSTPLTIGVPGYIAARKNRCPLVFEVRDLWPQIPIAMGVLRNPLLIKLAQGLERFIYKNSARVVALSPGMAIGVEEAGFSKDKISIIPNAADLDLFSTGHLATQNFSRKEYGLPHGQMILYPGTLGYVNGVSYLVDVAHQMLKINKDIIFVIVGDGAEREKVKKLAIETGTWCKNFFILAPMPKYKVAQVFSDSTLIVSTIIDLPALEANSANKFFDALAAGKPVAINYGGWQKEMIQKYSIGLVLDRNSSKAANQISEFVGKPGALERCGENAKALAINEFSRDVLAGELETVLKSAVGK